MRHFLHIKCRLHFHLVLMPHSFKRLYDSLTFNSLPGIFHPLANIRNRRPFHSSCPCNVRSWCLNPLCPFLVHKSLERFINHLTPNGHYMGRTAQLINAAFYIFIQQIYVLNILNMLHNLLFFFSKCRLFHNATFFGSCIIHILNTGCAKI